MKNKRTTHRTYISCWSSIILLLAVIAVSAVLFAAWVSFCTIPKEVSLSNRFIQSVLQNDHSAVEALQLANNEITRGFAWYGTITIRDSYIRETCSVRTCVLDSLSADMSIKQFHICAFSRKVKHTTVTIHIDMSKNQVEVDLYPGTMWPDETSGDSILSDILQVKDLAINSIKDTVWKANSALSLEMRRRIDGWSIQVFTPHGELINGEEVDRSDYQNIREEKQ